MARAIGLGLSARPELNIEMISTHHLPCETHVLHERRFHCKTGDIHLQESARQRDSFADQVPKENSFFILSKYSYILLTMGKKLSQPCAHLDALMDSDRLS